MNYGPNRSTITGVADKPGILMPALLSIALLVILFSVPQPSVRVNHPFKAELFLSIFLMAFLVLMRRLSPANSLSAPAKAIAYAIGIFILWSAVSALWGSSLNSVAHHTLLWSLYLVIFLIFTSKIWPDADLRFVSTTFILVSLILGLLCIFDYFLISDFTSSEGDLRIRYGKYAELLVTISPILWAAAIYVRKRRRMAFVLVIAVLSWVTVMLSLSKGAFIAGIIAFFIFFAGTAVLSGKGFRKRVFAFAGIWFAVTIGTQVFFSFFSAVPSTTSYITGAADQTRSTSAMRIFTWSIARQMVHDHWLMGVGADNFGLAFNHERAVYRETHPGDTTGEIGEDFIVERAHNEPLQVLSELGIVGLIIFSLPFLLLALHSFKKFFQHGLRSSPMLWAAFAGMAAFAVSSQFSSFSFRSTQNGVVFFMVFAVAVNELAKPLNTRKTNFSRQVVLLSWMAALLLAVFCATKVLAEYHAYLGERSETYNIARDHFRSAVKADPEYAGAFLLHASRAVRDEDPSAAAELTRKAIDYGLGITPVYSQLAKQQIKAGNAADAEATYREALSIYPRSVYMRMEFVIFLEDQGRSDAAAEQAAISRSIDLRQANGWYIIIREGSVAAFYRSQIDPNVTPPVELIPSSAVRQYVDKIPGT